MRGVFPPPFQTTDKGHGRVEVRSIRVCDAHEKIRFPGARQVCEVTRTRWLKGRDNIEVILFITSLAIKKASPEKLLEIIRGHWSIENNLHYVKDISFDEDRIRYTINPSLVSALRSLTITISRFVGFAFIPDARRFFVMNFDWMLRKYRVA